MSAILFHKPFKQDEDDSDSAAKILSRIIDYLPLFDILVTEALNKTFSHNLAIAARPKLTEILIDQLGGQATLSAIAASHPVLPPLTNPNWQTLAGIKLHLCANLCVKLHTAYTELICYQHALELLARKYVALLSNISPSTQHIMQEVAKATKDLVDPNAFMLHEQLELQKLLKPSMLEHSELYRALNLVLHRVNKVSKQCLRTQNEITIVQHRNAVSLQTLMSSRKLTGQDTAQANEIVTHLSRNILCFDDQQLSVINRYAAKLINSPLPASDKRARDV